MIQVDVPITADPEVYSDAIRDVMVKRIAALMKEKNAMIIAHYYTDPDVQFLADQTGGFVGDSLAMAEAGLASTADTLIVAGVKFMGETAKILSPKKTVLMPTLAATCSLDLGCPIDAFNTFCDQHPDRTVVVYANTSAAVKARADWVVTSSCAVEIVSHLDQIGEKILWAPDRFLGRYVQQQTGADMVIWKGSCVVHEEFKALGIHDLKLSFPEAAVLVHPESPEAVIEMADVVGSTTQLLKAVAALPNKEFIVATDRGIFYKMQQAAPEKLLLEAPTSGHGATCKSCAHCPWMAMNTLKNVEETLRSKGNEVFVSEALIHGAKASLNKMLEFNS